MVAINQKVQNYKFNKEISQKLNMLSKLDNYHTALALLSDWALIFISIFITYHCFYLYPIAILIIGSRQRALSTIFHDAAHGRAANNRILNFLEGTLFSGFFVFQSINQYKLSHVKSHHGNLGNHHLDPDYKYYINEGLYKKSLTPKKFFIHHVFKNLIFLKSPSYIFYIIKNRFYSAILYPIEFLIMILTWIIALSIMYHINCVHIIFWFWVVPFFTTHAMIGYFIELSEHYPLLGTSNQMLFLSRNRFSHWLEAFFFSIHHENYHLVHHLRPNIPFWNMKKAHEIMLSDTAYSNRNEEFGGIFFSSNNVKPLIYLLCKKAPHSLICNFEN